MQENPYASPQTDIDTPREDADFELEPAAVRENPYLKPLFRCRKYPVLAFALFVLFAWLATNGASTVVAIGRLLNLGLLVGLVHLFGVLAAGLALVYVLVTIAFHVLLFLAAHRHGGVIYALGHLAISISLMPTFFFGILVVPLMVRGDIERLAIGSRNGVQG